MPCESCVAFEALATHAAGRALGLQTASAASGALAPAAFGQVGCTADWESSVLAAAGASDFASIAGELLNATSAVHAALDPPDCVLIESHSSSWS